MINEFPRPRAIARMLLDSALLAILLAVGFTLFSDQAESMAFAFPCVLATAAMVSRLDAQSEHGWWFTGKRLLAAVQMGVWGALIAIAGRSIVAGHYFNSGALICGSLAWVLTSRALMCLARSGKSVTGQP